MIARKKSSKLALDLENDAAIFILLKIISFSLLFIQIYTPFLSSGFSLNNHLFIISRINFLSIQYKLNTSFVVHSIFSNDSRKTSSILKSFNQISLILFSEFISVFLNQSEKLLYDILFLF
jgi:hypothetical protein